MEALLREAREGPVSSGSNSAVLPLPRRLAVTESINGTHGELIAHPLIEERLAIIPNRRSSSSTTIMPKRVCVKGVFSPNGVPTLRKRNEAVRLHLRQSSGTLGRDGIPLIMDSGRTCGFPGYHLPGWTVCHCRILGNVLLPGLESDSSRVEFPPWGDG